MVEITVGDRDLKAWRDQSGRRVVWCLLLMIAGPCLRTQVLHLKNKRVIVVSTSVSSLPPSAPSCLCIYSCLLGWTRAFIAGLTCKCLPGDTFWVCCLQLHASKLSCISLQSHIFIRVKLVIVTVPLCLQVSDGQCQLEPAAEDVCYGFGQLH